MKLILPVLPVLFAFISGCGTASKGREFDTLRQRPAHPFTVRVITKPRLIRKDGREQPELSEIQMPSIVSGAEKKRISRELATGLRDYNAFVAVLDEEESPEAPVDAEVQVTISRTINYIPASGDGDANGPRDELPLGETSYNRLIWPNLFLWMLLGFPGWFLSDVDFDAQVSVEYRLLRRTTQQKDGDLLVGRFDFKDIETLNFLSRAGLWQYMQQIVIPPFLVKPNLQVADQSLFEKFISKMKREIGKDIKENLTGNQLDLLERLPYLELRQVSGESYLIVLSKFELEGPAEFTVADGDMPGTPQKLNLTRLIKSATPQATLLERFLESDPAFLLGYRNDLFNYVNYCKVSETPLANCRLAKISAYFVAQKEPWTWTVRVKESTDSPAGSGEQPAKVAFDPKR